MEMKNGNSIEENERDRKKNQEELREKELEEIS